MAVVKMVMIFLIGNLSIMDDLQGGQVEHILHDCLEKVAELRVSLTLLILLIIILIVMVLEYASSYLRKWVQ